MPVSLLTRVRQTAESVQKAERSLHRARLRHYEAIAAARKKHSLAEIGLALGVTRQRVAQLVRWGKSEKKKAKKEP
jgi:DNA-directed RNA polymerase sigma subunit (sigma70/sigma32)